MIHRPAQGSAIVAAVIGASFGGTALAFNPPTTVNPEAIKQASIGVNYTTTQSFSRTLLFSFATPTVFYPEVYWFKYTSNGEAIVKFDTLGSDFGTNGPGGGSGGGPLLGAYNQSQIAVYRADGTNVAIAKGTRGIDGDPDTIYPKYSSNAGQWYVPQGLSEAYFYSSAPDNPHWSASPTDPGPFSGWAAPGNEGNSQKYFPPHYPVALNEYQVWDTALSTVVLNPDGTVFDNDTSTPGIQPRQQPGWRYFDHARHGPGTPWNRFDLLPAGDYYIAVSSASPVFAGDTYVEEVMRFPVHFNPTTGQANQPQLTAPMTGFSYYQPPSSQAYYGTIQLNVTTILPGDVDRDADVDFDDLGQLLGAYDSVEGFIIDYTDFSYELLDPDFNANADFNFDEAVGFDDLGILLGNYGNGVPGAVVGQLDSQAIEALAAVGIVVPEPSSAGLMLVAGGALLRRRR